MTDPTLGRYLLWCLAIAIAGCAADKQVRRIDLSERRGVYVVVFTADQALRSAAEERLTTDLQQRGIAAFASAEDIDSVTTSSADQLMAAATARAAAAVVVLNPVNSNGGGSRVENPERVSPIHPDLRAFYEYSRRVAERTDDTSRRTVVEVNLFYLGPDGAELFWSGTAWAFDADGAGAAIPGLSEQIANAMSEARERLLGD